MRKLLSFFILFSLIFSLYACANQEADLTNHAVYEDFELILEDANIKESENKTKLIVVNATYINNSDEPQYAYSSFAVKAFQNDIELNELSDINNDQVSLIQEVKDGNKIAVSYIFELNDESAIEVLISEPTADQKIIAHKIYFE